MSTDDAAKNSTSLESINSTSKSIDPTSATPHEQVPLSAEEAPRALVSGAPEQPGPSKAGENDNAEVQLKDLESRDITEAGEVNGGAEAVSGTTQPPSELHGESGETLEAVEAADGVLAWSPEEDHEHKRVKVSYTDFFTCSSFLFLVPCDALDMSLALFAFCVLSSLTKPFHNVVSLVGLLGLCLS